MAKSKKKQKPKLGGTSNKMLIDTYEEKLQQAIVIKAEPPNNWSPRKISSWLEDNHGKKVSHMSVKKWLDRRKVAIVKQVYGDKDFLKSVQKDYGLLLDRYVKSVILLVEMLNGVERSRNEDIVTKTECATKLANSIRECVITAKEIVVGDTSVESQVKDVEEEILDASQGVPGLAELLKEEEKLD